MKQRIFSLVIVLFCAAFSVRYLLRAVEMIQQGNPLRYMANLFFVVFLLAFGAVYAMELFGRKV